MEVAPSVSVRDCVGGTLNEYSNDSGSLDEEFSRLLAEVPRDPLSHDSLCILLAVDDSPASRTATLAAAALAELSGGTLEVLHVREGQLIGRSAAPLESKAEGVAVIDAALAELRCCGVTARGQLRRGRPGAIAEGIVAEAREIGADVIVLGTNRRSGLWRLLAPSVAVAVVRGSCCPVLVAR